jgi:hypothetical protein
MPSRFVAAWGVALGLILAVAGADARVWKPTPVEQISDYLFIIDPKPDGSQVMVFWIAPEVAGDAEGQARLRAWTRNHILVGIAEVDVKDGSSLMPRRVSDPQIIVGGGRPRNVLEQREFSPDLQRASEFARNLIGTAGQAFRFFAVPQRQGACAPGSVQVLYERERYTYRLPAPGCGPAPQ